jgi:acyl dehydratase
MVAVMTNPQIGAVARRTRTVTHRDIELFTEITGDRNPIHFDEGLATSSQFGGIVAQAVAQTTAEVAGKVGGRLPS